MPEPGLAVDSAAPAGIRGEPVANGPRCPLPHHRSLGQPETVAHSGLDNRGRLPTLPTTMMMMDSHKGGLNTEIRVCYQLCWASVASLRQEHRTRCPTSSGTRVRLRAERASELTGIRTCP